MWPVYQEVIWDSTATVVRQEESTTIVAIKDINISNKVKTKKSPKLFKDKPLEVRYLTIEMHFLVQK